MSRALVRPGWVDRVVHGLDRDPNVGGVTGEGPAEGAASGASVTGQGSASVATGDAGTSVPVVLLHGLRTSRTMWRAQVEALERSGHRALAVDLPGHGTRRGERFTLESADETVVRAVDEVGGRALVVGLSLGGYVAIAHAARHPEQVTGLVAASCCTRPWPVLVDGWALAARVIGHLPDGGARLNGLLVDLLLPAAGATDSGAGGFALEVMGDVLRAMRGAHPVDDLARVEAPVWLVNGQLDHFRGEERTFLRACRSGRLVVVPGATHLVSLVRPTRFTRVVLEALADVERAQRTRLAALGESGRVAPRGAEVTAGGLSRPATTP